MDESGEWTASSFIPFCEFGGDGKQLGERREEFDVPVCSSFSEKVLAGQLCYQLEVNQYKDKHFTDGQLRKAVWHKCIF